MNFFDYLVNPALLIDPKSQYTPKLQMAIHPDEMFSRSSDQSGSGRPGLQSFVRNLADVSHGSAITDFMGQHVLGDLPAHGPVPPSVGPNPDATTADTMQGPTNLIMSQLVQKWLNGGTMQ